MTQPIGLALPSPNRETKQRLITAGLRLLLERGYHAVGVQELLTETDVPKGSFYHHFESKEDFALQVIGAYQANVHAPLDATLRDRRRPPLLRTRRAREPGSASAAPAPAHDLRGIPREYASARRVATAVS